MNSFKQFLQTKLTNDFKRKDRFVIANYILGLAIANNLIYIRLTYQKFANFSYIHITQLS
jgi:hypothetical protein